jgi:hypothetical protein
MLGMGTPTSPEIGPVTVVPALPSHGEMRSGRDGTRDLAVEMVDLPGEPPPLGPCALEPLLLEVAELQVELIDLAVQCRAHWAQRTPVCHASQNV